MKNFILSFALAMTLISGTVILNCIFPSCGNREQFANLDIDLSIDDNTMCDLVFDANGNLLTKTTYKWDNLNNTRGAVIDRWVCNNNRNLAK